MNRVAVLLKTPSVVLRAFDHPPNAEHSDPEVEVAREHSINFVEAGTFDIRAAGRHWHFEPGTIFVSRPGLEFSCRHDCHEPVDRCLTVSISERSAEELRQAGVEVTGVPLAYASKRQRFLKHRLAGCGPGQEMRLELLAGALCESLASPGAPGAARRGLRSTPGITHVMRCIERAMELADAEYQRPLTLSDMASAAGMSAFHFARIFHELIGLPPHRYLTAVRLRQAATRLDQGAGVTETCYQVGFGTLSHFITAFRKRYGVVPGEVRRGTGYAAIKTGLRTPIWGTKRRTTKNEL